MLASCTPADVDPQPDPSQSTPTAPPLTVLSTDAIRVTDPAAITDPGSVVLSLNVFQRLMTAEPGQAVLKPDAAKDCLFTADTVYTCTLNPNLVFHNGHQLTSSDVKFSIQRALRLDVVGSSAPLLSTLRRIETPDPLTVRFVLSRVDTQFGWALASPAASIVDEQVYNSDEVRPNDQPVVGSGPFAVAGFEKGVLRLQRNTTYVGRTPARMDSVLYQTVKDSAALEDAMNTGTADVVWRGLSAAAITRYTRQVTISDDDTTDAGYGMQTQTGTRVLMLAWSPASAHRLNEDLRNAVAVALQGDRTLDSVVPGGIPNHISAFPLGGSATARHHLVEPDPDHPRLRPDDARRPGHRHPDPDPTGGHRWDECPAAGGRSDRRRRSAGSDGAGPQGVDVDRAGLAAALPGGTPAEEHRGRRRLERQYRGAGIGEEAEATRAMASLQRQAAADLVLVPMTQSDEYLFTAPKVEVPANSFGPGWQLGLWGMFRG